MGLTIKTDGKWRQFKSRADIPPAIANYQFAYLSPRAPDAFFKFHGHWWHVTMFEGGGPRGWDGTHRDGVDEGMLVKISRDGRRYKIATYRII